MNNVIFFIKFLILNCKVLLIIFKQKNMQLGKRDQGGRLAPSLWAHCPRGGAMGPFWHFLQNSEYPLPCSLTWLRIIQAMVFTFTDFNSHKGMKQWTFNTETNLIAVKFSKGSPNGRQATVTGLMPQVEIICIFVCKGIKGYYVQ
jgi:hypothetical protein